MPVRKKSLHPVAMPRGSWGVGGGLFRIDPVQRAIAEGVNRTQTENAIAEGVNRTQTENAIAEGVNRTQNRNPGPVRFRS